MNQHLFRMTIEKKATMVHWPDLIFICIHCQKSEEVWNYYLSLDRVRHINRLQLKWSLWKFWATMVTWRHIFTHTNALLSEERKRRGCGEKYIEKKNTSNASKYRFKTIADNDERTYIYAYGGKKERKKEKKSDREQVKYSAYVRRLTGLLMLDHRRLVFLFFPFLFI